MWVRVVAKQGTALGVTLPKKVLKALGWEKGDYLALRMETVNSISVTRFSPAQVPDRMRRGWQPEEIIHG